MPWVSVNAPSRGAPSTRPSAVMRMLPPTVSCSEAGNSIVVLWSNECGAADADRADRGMMEEHHQEDGRDGQCGDLEPVLEGLHEGDALHPAAGDAQGHDDPEDDDPDPLRAPEGHLEGQPRPLELGQEVEAADDEDDAGGGTAEERRLQPALGEVRNRVGAEAPQRRGHGDQEHQVTGGVPDGVPEGPEPFEHGQSGNAQERRRREVLPRDGGGIEERRYLSGRPP